MDRYIVHNNVSGQTTTDQAGQQTKGLVTTSTGNNGVANEPQSAFIIQHAGTSKMLEDATAYKLDNGENEYEKALQTETQFTAKQLDTSQFNEGVGNTTYIIDNNSSNSIDSVRIGNHSFVPVVDSSLYNISVAGSTTQYTIEGVVNPSLGNYIIEAPAYIVETKPQQHTMYIQQEQPQQHQTIQTQIEDPKKEKTKRPGEKKSKKVKEQETGPFFCNVCSAEFNSSASLRFHSYHHNPKSKRFSCIGCEKAFEKDKEKDEHELSCEVNYKNEKFSCMFCDMPFAVPKSLRVHENKHRPVKKTKKYKHMCVCIKCNKAFDAIYTLKIHIKKIHGGVSSPEKKKKKKKDDEATVIQGLKFEDFS